MLTKKSKGLRATGMAAVSCARHQLFRPLGIGDLQKGERYVLLIFHLNVFLFLFCRQCNMDYIFASSIMGIGLRSVVISYDVACQWFVNFWNRVCFLPTALRPFSLSIRALVPKFHLQSHNEKCHSAFSFNFFRGAARTDGEGVERNWDDLNGQAPSTSEMLPGARWDTLDDCCAWVNWRKTMGLGALKVYVFQATYSYNI